MTVTVDANQRFYQLAHVEEALTPKQKTRRNRTLILTVLAALAVASMFSRFGVEAFVSVLFMGAVVSCGITTIVAAGMYDDARDAGRKARVEALSDAYGLDIPEGVVRDAMAVRDLGIGSTFDLGDDARLTRYTAVVTGDLKFRLYDAAGVIVPPTVSV